MKFKLKIKTINTYIKHWKKVENRCRYIANKFSEIKKLYYEYMEIYPVQFTDGSVGAGIEFQSAEGRDDTISWKEDGEDCHELVLTTDKIANPKKWFEKVKKETMAEVL